MLKAKKGIVVLRLPSSFVCSFGLSLIITYTALDTLFLQVPNVAKDKMEIVLNMAETFRNSNNSMVFVF